MTGKFRKIVATILLTTCAASFAAFGDNAFLYTFEDETEAVSCDGSVTDFANADGTSNGTVSNNSDVAVVYAGGYSHKALHYTLSAGATTKLTGATVANWGSKLMLEARIKCLEIPAGEQIDLVKSASSGAVHWHISSDGKMQLDLNDGIDSFGVTTVASALPPNIWTELYVVVDLSKSNYADAVKMYSKSDGDSAIQPLTISGAYNANVDLPSAGDAVELIHRTSPFSLRTDFVKVTANASFDINNFDTSTFECISSADYFAPNASSAIEVAPQNFIRRTLNKGEDFANGAANEGVTVIYDSEVNRNEAFYGVFELSFDLDKTKYVGTVMADIYIKRLEDASFKKIGEIGTSSASVTYYWDSRSSAFDWTADDARPYKTSAPVKFKLVVR